MTQIIYKHDRHQKMNSDVILLHGPPYSGRTLCYWQSFSGTHERICPEAVYKEYPDLTIRQLVNKYILNPIKQGKKIVIDDSFQTFAKRDSFINLVKKKVPGVQCLCYNVTPRYGTDQLHWAREYSSAQGAAFYHREGVEARISVNIESWLANQETPEEDEGYLVRDSGRTLYAESIFKFEVPCLLIQWEGMIQKKSGDLIPVEGIVKATSMWYSTNPCGRIIVICDGSSSSGVTPGERELLVRDQFKDLIKQAHKHPMYVLIVTPQVNHTPHSVPPQPGLLAFLQQAHCLDLHHPGSMYLYHTPNHMKMAENAGMKYIKATRVFDHPMLAQSCHATAQPKLPPMLQHLTVVPPSDLSMDAGEADAAATVPMYDEMLVAEGWVAKFRMCPGRTMYAFVKDAETIESYQTTYREHAIMTTSNHDSRIRALSRHCSGGQSSATSQGAHAESLDRSAAETSTLGRSRGLPKWMLSAEGSSSSNRRQKAASSLDETMTGSLPIKRQLSADSSSRTMYVLSADELLDMAKIILKEAGKPLPADEEIQATLDKEPGDDQEVDDNPKVKVKVASKVIRSRDRDIFDEILSRRNDSDGESDDNMNVENTMAQDEKSDVPVSSVHRHPDESHDTFLDDLLGEVKPKQSRVVIKPSQDAKFADCFKEPGKQVANKRVEFDRQIPETVSVNENLQTMRRKSTFREPRLSSSDSDWPGTVLVEESLPMKKRKTTYGRSRVSSSDSDRAGNGQTASRQSGICVVPDSLVSETVTTVPETVLLSDRETCESVDQRPPRASQAARPGIGARRRVSGDSRHPESSRLRFQEDKEDQPTATEQSMPREQTKSNSVSKMPERWPEDSESTALKDVSKSRSFKLDHNPEQNNDSGDEGLSILDGLI